MLKIFQRNYKIISVSHNSQAFEVRLLNATQSNYVKRSHHIWNGRQQNYLCTACNNRRSTPYSSPLINSSYYAASFATLPDIPVPPVAPTPVQETLVSSIAANGEPTFASMGLGGWSPVGIVQNCMEYLHVSLDVPWWGAIVIGTIVVRVCLFPLVIKAQQNSALMNNHLPQMQVLQMKMTQARQTGNQLEAARCGQELMVFMKEKGLNPVKNMIVPLAQAPFFISFFLGLRGMSNYPVESMTSGGLFWFSNLTIPDPFYILPIVTSLTMLATIELGTDSARMSSQNLGLMKYALRAIPVIMLPFTINFPGAILCYWVSSNFVSLGQVAFLRIPKIRQYFNIPVIVAHRQDTLPMKPKGFVKGAKESWSNLKLTRELEERLRVDEMRFNQAGKGPLQKTYKFNPTVKAASVDAAKKIEAK